MNSHALKTNLLPHLILAALLAASCDPKADGSATQLVSQSAAAEAPNIGDEGSLDSADHGCTLIMRDLMQLRDDEGEPMHACDEEGCHYIWEGNLDVSSQALTDGAQVAVLYHLQGSPDWWQTQAQATGPGNPGFLRMRFRLDAHLPGLEMDSEELRNHNIEFIPFIQQTNGSRLFDHNRIEGDLDNYLSRGVEAFYLGMDMAVCNHRPHTSALFFSPTWAEYPQGTLRAQGQVAIHYDLNRLKDCRESEGWDIQAFVQVDQDGPVLSGSVVGFDHKGDAYAWPLLLDVPQDTQRLKVWFKASSADGTCTVFDSDFGNNYSFAVNPAPDDGPCAHVESWQSRYGGTASCPDYQIDSEHDASFCEFAPSGLGDGYEGHYGIPYRWLEAWLWIGQNEGQVLNAGMYVAYQDLSDATSSERWILGQRKDDGSFQTGFNYLYTGYMGGGSYRYVIDHFAFFIDVQRTSGQVERLWQSHQGANYFWSDAFSMPSDTQYIPYGRVQWANPQSEVFSPLRACR